MLKLVEFDLEFSKVPEVTFSMRNYDSEDHFPSAELEIVEIRKDSFLISFSCLVEKLRSYEIWWVASILEDNLRLGSKSFNLDPNTRGTEKFNFEIDFPVSNQFILLT